MILSNKNAHMTMARGCYGNLGITNIHVNSSMADSKYMNMCEYVAVPTLQHVTMDTMGSSSSKGIIQKMKKFLGSSYEYLQVGSPW